MSFVKSMIHLSGARKVLPVVSWNMHPKVPSPGQCPLALATYLRITETCTCSVVQRAISTGFQRVDVYTNMHFACLPSGQLVRAGLCHETGISLTTNCITTRAFKLEPERSRLKASSIHWGGGEGRLSGFGVNRGLFSGFYLENEASRTFCFSVDFPKENKQRTHYFIWVSGTFSTGIMGTL